MAFLSQTSCLITDSYSNIYNFLWYNEELILIYFDKVLKKMERKVLVENCTMEFDAVIDNNDRIYLICHKKDSSIILMIMDNGDWETKTIKEADGKQIYNLNVITTHDNLHIFYYVPVDEEKNMYKIYHLIYDSKKWNTIEICQIKKKEVLNPFQLLNYQDKIYLAYYDLFSSTEQIFVRQYDTINRQWSERIQITSNNKLKLYVDMLVTDKEDIHITYTQYKEGNFVVKYEKYKINDNMAQKVQEKELSNPGNCTHPSFVYHESKLWNVWTEYNSVVSCYSTDMGISWSRPYLWRESKYKDFLRYKFSTNQYKVKENYLLNYCFGYAYPDISFVGFGPLENTIEVSIKNDNKESGFTEVKDDTFINKGKIIKKIDEYEESEKENQKILSELNKINERVKKIEEKFDEIEDLKKIKEYLYNSRDMKKIQEGANRLENLFNEVEKLKALNNLKEQIDQYNLFENIKKIEERLTLVEKYLNRRKRGPFFNTRE